MTLLRRQPKKPRRTGRLRCPGHLKFVRSHMCALVGCSNVPVEAAHWRLCAHAGTGQKPDDDRAIPLCWKHHREAHAIGEETFAREHRLNIDGILEELRKTSPALRRLKEGRR